MQHPIRSDICKDAPFDCDYFMEINGWQLTKPLKSSAELTRVLIILVLHQCPSPIVLVLVQMADDTPSVVMGFLHSLFPPPTPSLFTLFLMTVVLCLPLSPLPFLESTGNKFPLERFLINSSVIYDFWSGHLSPQSNPALHSIEGRVNS